MTKNDNMAPASPPRVLIVAENTSARFGGEAALPLHYFRVLRERGVPVWLATHARVRPELAQLFPDAGERIVYVEDTRLHQWLSRLGDLMPARLAFATTGLVLRLVTQVALRRIARDLVRRERVSVIHQPMPVSPKDPSLLFGLDAPVVIGPMNGAMDYPPAFRRQQGRVGHAFVAFGRWCAHGMNWLMPGKLRAAVLLVANARTRAALPAGSSAQVIDLVENGVDLSLWNARGATAPAPDRPGPVRFAFLGRLVDWKAVDVLLEAFVTASRTIPMTLAIMGDGPERTALMRQAEALGVLARHADEVNRVHFAGWLPQAEAATELERHDCLLLPSLMECGGAVVLEAMALGMPVIATAWGGPADYLDETCGVLVAPDSRAALVLGFQEAMVRLGADAALRRRMGAAGRAKILQHYDWERKADRMLEIYRGAQSALAGRAISAASRS